MKKWEKPFAVIFVVTITLLVVALKFFPNEIAAANNWAYERMPHHEAAPTMQNRFDLEPSPESCENAARLRESLASRGIFKFDGSGGVTASPLAYVQLTERARDGLVMASALELACELHVAPESVLVTVRSSRDNHKIGEGTIDRFTEY